MAGKVELTEEQYDEAKNDVLTRLGLTEENFSVATDTLIVPDTWSPPAGMTPAELHKLVSIAFYVIERQQKKARAAKTGGR